MHYVLTIPGLRQLSVDQMKRLPHCQHDILGKTNDDLGSEVHWGHLHVPLHIWGESGVRAGLENQQDEILRIPVRASAVSGHIA